MEHTLQLSRGLLARVLEQGIDRAHDEENVPTLSSSGVVREAGEEGEEGEREKAFSIKDEKHVKGRPLLLSPPTCVS